MTSTKNPTNFNGGNVNKLELAYLTLMEEAWELTKKEVHKGDLPKIEKRYKEKVEEFKNNPIGYISDTMEDIKAGWQW